MKIRDHPDGMHMDADKVCVKKVCVRKVCQESIARALVVPELRTYGRKSLRSKTIELRIIGKPVIRMQFFIAQGEKKGYFTGLWVKPLLLHQNTVCCHKETGHAQD